MAGKRSTDNKWYQQVWLPFAAATYIVICIFDFIVMPVYVTAHNSRIENAVFKTLDAKDAANFADTLAKANQAQRQWNPLTLLGAGMFHLAFGALLTGGAVTRGFAKKSEIEGYYRYGNNSYYGEDEEEYYRDNSRPNYQGSYNRPYRYRSGQNQQPNNNGPSPNTENLE